jgi:hypothetical protein
VRTPPPNYSVVLCASGRPHMAPTLQPQGKLVVLSLPTSCGPHREIKLVPARRAK